MWQLLIGLIVGYLLGAKEDRKKLATWVNKQFGKDRNKPEGKA